MHRPVKRFFAIHILHSLFKKKTILYYVFEIKNTKVFCTLYLNAFYKLFCTSLNNNIHICISLDIHLIIPS